MRPLRIEVPVPLSSLVLLAIVASCGALACERTPGRVDAVRPAEPRVARPLGRENCAVCHEEEARFCDYGAHRRVQCEHCHGPGSLHAEGDAADRPKLVLGDVALCLSCHGGEPGAEGGAKSRIGSFAAHLGALEKEHKVELRRTRADGDCVSCHDPHLLE